MADQDPKKLRALFDLFRRQQQPPPKPEPSYFDQTEADREKARPQQKRPKVRPAAMPPAIPPSMTRPARPAPPSADRHDPRNTFNRRSKVEETRQDSILALYKSERQRATALAHLDDAAALRKDAEERFQAAMAPITAKWDRIDTSKPVAGDLVIDLKAREKEVVAARDKDLAEIETDLALSLKAAHTVDVKVDIQTVVQLLGYTPDASEELAIAARNWPQRFGRAVDPEQDEARQVLRTKVVTIPENEEADPSPDLAEQGIPAEGDTDHAPETDEMGLYEQYEMDWLSVFKEEERESLKEGQPEQSESRSPKPS